MIGVNLQQILLAGQILSLMLMTVVSIYAVKVAFPIRKYRRKATPKAGGRRNPAGGRRASDKGKAGDAFISLGVLGILGLASMANFFSLQECHPATGCQTTSDYYLLVFVVFIIFGAILKLRPAIKCVFGSTWPFLPLSMIAVTWIIYAVIL